MIGSKEVYCNQARAWVERKIGDVWPVYRIGTDNIVGYQTLVPIRGTAPEFGGGSVMLGTSVIMHLRYLLNVAAEMKQAEDLYTARQTILDKWPDALMHPLDQMN